MKTSPTKHTALWFAVLSLLILTGCASKPAPVSCDYMNTYPTNVPDSDRDRSLTTTDTCAAPCWHGLIPGQSTLDDALKILPTVASINTSSIETKTTPLLPGQTDITWESKYASRDWARGGEMQFLGDKLVQIHTSLEYELPLQALLDKFGEPAAFTTAGQWIDTPSRCFNADLYWFEKGVGVETAYLPIDQTPSGSITIRSVYYFTPSPDAAGYTQSLGGPGANADDYFQNWHGLDGVTFK